MTRHRVLFAVVAALLIASAGCSSIGSQTSPATSPDGTDGTSTPDAGQLQGEAVEAMAAVDQYRVEANESRTVIANLQREITVEQTIAVDRASQSLHVAANQSSRGQTVALDIYLVNGSLYQRSPAYVRQFSTEWLEIDTVENLTRLRRALDPLERQERILDGAAVSYNGTETVDGTDVYRVETDADPERLEDLFAEQMAGPGSQLNESTYSISNASFTFWISTETNRPVKVAGRIDSSISARGRTISLRQTFTFRYAYDAPVSIELPEESASAVKLSEALNETDAGA